jgi:dolichyl-phosphate-mannose--protein O-mannosyl transferase
VTRRDLLAPALLFLLAFGLRVADLDHPPFRFMDEGTHIPAAVHYVEAGQFEPDFWEHPPLRHLLAWAGLQAFGDNPYGWRLRNVLFGAAAAALTWLFALAVTASRRAALLAGALLATDPLHVVLSRFTYEEIYGGALFTGAVAVLALHRQRTGRLILAALLLGCALATKWYYAPGWLLMAALTAWDSRRLRDPGAIAGTLAFLGCCWLLVPAGVYAASFAPWFGRGYGLGELVELTASAYRSLQSIGDEAFKAMDLRTVFHGHLSAAEWFVAPVMMGEGTRLGADRGEFILFVNDLPVWGLTLPAMAVVSVAAARRRSLALAWPVLFFGASYALFLVVKRPAFLYSAVPLLPFAFTAIAAALWLVAERLGGARWGRRAFWLVAALLVAWNLYLFPLVTAKPVPLAPYQWVLERAAPRLH